MRKEEREVIARVVDQIEPLIEELRTDVESSQIAFLTYLLGMVREEAIVALLMTEPRLVVSN